jgi:hypothetical protein
LRNAGILAERGIISKKPAAIYSRIDTDDKGFIFFHELYRFMVKREVDFSVVAT